jgi:phosphoribosylglycinamide formyltransferase-1
LERARGAGIETGVLEPGAFSSRREFTRSLVSLLKERDIGLVVLAGFMFVLTEEFATQFANRAINVHPALIPAFCGDGFYGLRVHRAALRKGVKVSGATVHFVTGVTDGGPIILQKALPVLEDDTPERLQARVMTQAEQELLPRAVSLFCEGRLTVKDGRVVVN